MYTLSLKLATILFVISNCATYTIAHPVTSQAHSFTDFQDNNEDGLSNMTNAMVFSKRVAARPFGQQDVSFVEQGNLEKRYWEIKSVWIPDPTPCCEHTVIETVTITVDVLETSYVAPAPTEHPASLPISPWSDSPDTVTTPPIVEPIPSGPLTAPSATSSAAKVEATPMKAGPENGKLVFAHFMVGIVSTYTYTDWKYDITLAKSYGIDGFALNIGKDPYTDAQLDLAYQAAKDTGFKMFISFDFNWFKIEETQPVIDLVNKYIGKPAQFLLPGSDAAYVSSFAGDGFNWAEVRQKTGKNLYVVANWQPTPSNAANSGVQGLFSWYAWPSQDNKPINKKMDLEHDRNYLQVLDSHVEKTYMAPVSPWFFTHFGKEVSYTKNWVFLSETLWHDRWEQVLALQQDLQYIELVTWNDYGESHYLGPFDTPHTDDGSSKWAKDLPHGAMLEFAKPYINAFKTGSPTPIIDREMLVYWHRPTLKNVQCDATDNCGAKPDGWEMLSDEVFVTAFALAPGKVQVTSGNNATFEQDVSAGVTMLRVPMGAGEQHFQFTTSAGTAVNGTSEQSVRTSCIVSRDDTLG
ncbi:hypothetical protein QFC22_004826 [Naganishia vaughanmartiniae]|uniref:Uncharacterized protein n=1 Tax=Naganishia vaughanmartiniae TaxID=1424756 RepID=A0ACC2WZ14_9TREE|nr:hypothetical protein QFC22_004826 [Naganishia vaughanmartiniae]